MRERERDARAQNGGVARIRRGWSLFFSKPKNKEAKGSPGLRGGKVVKGQSEKVATCSSTADSGVDLRVQPILVAILHRHSSVLRSGRLIGRGLPAQVQVLMSIARWHRRLTVARCIMIVVDSCAGQWHAGTTGSSRMCINRLSINCVVLVL